MHRLDRIRNRLLIIDDDPSSVQVLGHILAELGDIHFALTAQDGLRLAAEVRPDLVLLDAELPDLSGLDVCRALKSEPRLAQVPVIFVTSHADDETELQALEAGAADFISKPPRAPVVVARVRTQLRVKHLNDVLLRLATLDGLTGVANRHHFDDTLAAEWRRAMRTGQPLSVVMLDVDFFKRYNDSLGHPAGDDCLRRVAQALQTAVQRPADLLARYGGEEFVALLPETGAAGALHLAQALHLAVQSLALPHGDSPVAGCVTVSVGVATLQAPVGGAGVASAAENDGMAALLAAADRALYAAKHAGRNRVHSAPPLPVPTMPPVAAVGLPACVPASVPAPVPPGSPVPTPPAAGPDTGAVTTLAVPMLR